MVDDSPIGDYTILIILPNLLGIVIIQSENHSFFSEKMTRSECDCASTQSKLCHEHASITMVTACDVKLHSKNSHQKQSASL